MQGRAQLKEQRLGCHPGKQRSPVTVLCVQFLLPQSIQDEIQVSAHRPQAAMAASQLPLPKATDGANTTAYIPKRVDLGTWNSKHSVRLYHCTWRQCFLNILRMLDSLLGAQERERPQPDTQLTDAFDYFPCVEPKGRAFSWKINFHPSGLQPAFLTWTKEPIQIFCSRYQVHYFYRLTNPLDCRGSSYMRGKHEKLILVHLGSCFHGWLFFFLLKLWHMTSFCVPVQFWGRCAEGYSYIKRL